jgi:hypothetical protein
VTQASAKSFPVRMPIYKSMLRELRELGCPTSVPWELVARHERQVRLNHNASLEALAGAGGLSPRDLLAVLTDHPARAFMLYPVELVVPQLNACILREAT